MGFSLKYKQLLNSNFESGAKVLLNTAFAMKTSYKVKKLLEACEQASKKIGKEYADEVVPKLKAIKDPVKQAEEHNKLDSTFGEKTVEIDRLKLSTGEIASCKLTPAQLHALDPILTEIELT